MKDAICPDSGTHTHTILHSALYGICK